MSSDQSLNITIFLGERSVPTEQLHRSTTRATTLNNTRPRHNTHPPTNYSLYDVPTQVRSITVRANLPTTSTYRYLRNYYLRYDTSATKVLSRQRPHPVLHLLGKRRISIQRRLVLASANFAHAEAQAHEDGVLVMLPMHHPRAGTGQPYYSSKHLRLPLARSTTPPPLLSLPPMSEMRLCTTTMRLKPLADSRNAGTLHEALRRQPGSSLTWQSVHSPSPSLHVLFLFSL